MFKKIDEGNVFFTADKNKVACGPRTTVLNDGSLVCTYMVQSKIGSNDFVPMISFSKDGVIWSEGNPIWPELIGNKSPFVSIRKMADGRFSIAGMMFDIAHPSESFWSDEAGGMKENKLVFSISEDGRTFGLPHVLELPYYASAEQPGGLLGDLDGTLRMIYAPYKTIEGRQEVQTNHLVLLKSENGGESFTSTIFGEIEGNITYAESWIARLNDGRLMVTSWQLDGKENPDVYFISKDNGMTFSGPFAMDFTGQTTSLTPYSDEIVLIPYNQRKEGTIGVWLSAAKPDEKGFNMIENQVVWEAEIATRSNTSGDFSQWTDYSFGEPQVTVLPDGTLLLVLWYEQPDGKGIRFVRLEWCN